MHRYIFVNLLEEERTVADICIRCQLIAHLHKMDAFSFHPEVNRTLTSCEAAAEYDDIVRYFVLFFLIIVD